jgi:galactan 5-O-arabinofuranosyltransferase
VLLFGLLFWLLRRLEPLGFPWEGEGLVAIAIGTGLAFLAVLVWMKGQERVWLASAQVLALGSGLLMLWLLRQAEYAPGGFWGDNWFSNAMIMHYKADAGNHDFAYRELHGFYPAFFHWVCARFAVIFGVPGHQMLPLAAIWTAYLLPVLTFRVWSKLLDGKTALLIVAGVIYLIADLLPAKPYEVISLVLVMPWFLFYLHKMEAEKGFLTGKVVVGGVLGGLLAMTYYYWFFLLALVFLGEFVLRTKKSGLKNTWQSFRPRFYVLFWLLLSSLPFWAPLLYDMLSHPFHSLQNRWYRPWMTTSSLFQYRPWIIYAGVIYLLFAAAKGWLPRFLLGLLAALLTWNLIGILFMAMGMPLLHARMNLFFDYAAILGLALGVVHLVELAREQWKSPEKWVLAGLVILTLFTVTFKMVNLQSDDAFQMAFDTETPTAALDPELRTAAPGKVLLTNRPEINAHLPVYLFVTHNAYYSHPAAEYEERILFLKFLSQSNNPDFVAWMLTFNRWTPVEMVYWEDETMVFGMDNFPSERATRQMLVKFEEKVFAGRYFDKHGAGGEDGIVWYGIEKPSFDLKAGFSELEMAMVRMYGVE